MASSGNNSFLQAFNIAFNGFDKGAEIMNLPGSVRRGREIQQEASLRNQDRADQQLALRRQQIGFNQRMALQQAELRRRIAEQQFARNQFRFKKEQEDYKRARQLDPTAEMVATRHAIDAARLQNEKRVVEIRNQLANTKDPEEAKALTRELTVRTAKARDMVARQQQITSAQVKLERQRKTSELAHAFTQGDRPKLDVFRELQAVNPQLAQNYAPEMQFLGQKAHRVLRESQPKLRSNDSNQLQEVVNRALQEGVLTKGQADAFSQGLINQANIASVRNQLSKALQQTANARYTTLSPQMRRQRRKDDVAFHKNVIIPLRKANNQAVRFDEMFTRIERLALNPNTKEGYANTAQNLMAHTKRALGLSLSDKDIANLDFKRMTDAMATRIAGIVRGGIDGTLLAGSTTEREFEAYKTLGTDTKATLAHNLFTVTNGMAAREAQQAVLKYYDQHPDIELNQGLVPRSAEKGAGPVFERHFIRSAANRMAAQFKRLYALARNKNLSAAKRKYYAVTARIIAGERSRLINRYRHKFLGQ